MMTCPEKVDTLQKIKKRPILHRPPIARLKASVQL